MLRFLSLLPLLLLTACATPVRLTLPIARLESPELQDEKRPRQLSVGYQSFSQVELSSDVYSVPVEENPHVIRHRYSSDDEDSTLGDLFSFRNFYVRFSYAFHIPIEIVYRAPDRVGLKTQLWGARAPQAERGNFSSSLFVNVAQRGRSGQMGTDANNPNSEYEVSSWLWDASWILGYRITHSGLLYGGPYYTYIPYSVKQRFAVGVASIDSEGKITNWGAHLGLQWQASETFNLKIEASMNQTRAYQAESQSFHGALAITQSF